MTVGKIKKVIGINISWVFEITIPLDIKFLCLEFNFKKETVWQEMGFYTCV